MRKERMKKMRRADVIIASALVLYTGAEHHQAHAFRHVQPEGDGDAHAHAERRNNGNGGGAFLRSSLKSLARVAERGASKWGDYVTSANGDKTTPTTRTTTSTSTSTTTSMKKSSSSYVSRLLHQRIQHMQDGDEEFDRMVKRMEEETSSTTTTTPEHFTQEILSYVLGGAAAGSAFAAATAGAFLGTSVIALGAIATVLFTEDGEEGEEFAHSVVGMEGTDMNGHGRKKSDEGGIEGEESCDYNGEGRALTNQGEGQNLPDSFSRGPKTKLDSYMLEDLKRCYNGIPGYAKTLDFSEQQFKDVCIVGGGGDETHESIMLNTGQELLPIENVKTNADAGPDEPNLKLAHAIEETCSSTEECDRIIPTIEDASRKRVNVVWHDAFNGGSFAHYYTKTQSTTKNERRGKQSHPRGAVSSKPKLAADTPGIDKQPADDHWAVLTDAERDGALLLSESFRVASSAFGLVADVVRFTGETAAATAGGAARLAGGTVRVSGWAVGSLGEAIENCGNGRDNGNGNQRLLPAKEAASGGELTTRKRQVAGKSIRLVGDAIEQVADSLLLAGSATEHVAFAAAGAAEGTVRLVENFASSLSDMFSKDAVEITGKKRLVHNIIHSSLEESDMESSDVGNELLTSAAEPAEDVHNETIEKTTNETASSEDEILDLYRWLSSLVVENAELMLTDTAGVQSLAPEMLGIFLLCFLASVIILSPRKDVYRRPIGQKNDLKNNEEGSPCEVNARPKDISFGDGRHKTSTKVDVEDHDSDSTLTVESTMKAGPDCATGQSRTLPTSLAKRAIDSFFFLLLMPPKLARLIVVKSFHMTFRKESTLLVIYMLGWTFLSRVSQYKSSVIQRKSELLGYKLAIESIGKSSLSMSESAAWLNSILNRLWRVQSGGLEPLLSSSVSANLADILERPYAKPSVVAHVSLNELTLGSSPPMVTRIELKGVDDDRSVVYMDVDVGMLFYDAILLLDIKPSSLEYRSIPSTTVSINSLDAKATLSVSVKCSPGYPYISFLHLSLVEIPDFNIRIEPQSESGLKGIDFGSFPVVSKWIKSSINSALAEYLSPQYISIDVLAWLKGNDKIVTYF